MATATVTPDSTAVDIKTYTETYRVYAKAKEDGKIDPESVKMTTAGKDDAAWKKLDADTSYTKLLEQSVKMYDAGTIAGISLLVEDPDEAVNIFNRGVSQKTGQKLKAVFTEISDDGLSLVFDPVADAYDTLELLNEATKRRNLSPADKAAKSLREAVKAMFPGLEGEALEARVQALFGGLQNS